jgi:mannose-6-phosphate isomerase-like protein (cupin superfamily)
MNVLGQVTGILAVAMLVPAAWGQAPADPAAPATPRRAAVAKPAQKVVVRNVSGTPIEGVRIAISGARTEEAKTSAEGVVSLALAAGSYRLRFEHEGFITLERDVTVRTAPLEVAVVLNRAPAPPEAPPPVAAPPPPPVVAPAGPPVNISIPAFLEKSFVGGREPMKESVLGCMPDATARLIQLREPLAAHTHADLDEVLYIVAGDGAVRIGEDLITVSPGSMSAIPRGTRHAIERRGRNPLIVLSTLAGAPCQAATTGPATAVR